jgi:hypothetical protein
MGLLREQFIEDSQGHKIAVLLPIEKYNRILKQLEEIEDIKAYDVAKASDDEIIPFETAVKEIEAKRNDL